MCHILALKKDYFLKKNPLWEASQKDQVTKKEEEIRLASDFSAQPSTPRGNGAMPTDYTRKERMRRFYIQRAVLPVGKLQTESFERI